MNSSSLVEVRALSKKYCRDLKKSLWYGLHDIGKEVTGRIQNAEPLRAGEFWALRNVSFGLSSGDTLGLLGRNGAGKTTLLRVLSGVIRPDIGFAKVRGGVAPLIELGAGFSPVSQEKIFNQCLLFWVYRAGIVDWN
jgi:lipopolysaccharide transport system ATP-binding protein